MAGFTASFFRFPDPELDDKTVHQLEVAGESPTPRAILQAMADHFGDLFVPYVIGSGASFGPAKGINMFINDQQVMDFDQPTTPPASGLDVLLLYVKAVQGGQDALEEEA